MEKFLTDKRIVVVLALITCLLWGVGYSCVKLGYSLFSIQSNDPYSKILFAGLRFVFAGVISLTLSAIINKKAPLVPAKKIGGVALYALFQTFLQYAALYIALGFISSAKSSILNQTGVFLLILLSNFLFRSDKFTWLKAVGCVVGFAGIVVVNLGGLDAGFSFMGEGLVLVSSLSAAIGYVICKKLGSTGDPITLTGWQQLIGGIGLTAVGLIAGGKLVPTNGWAYAIMAFLSASIAVAYVIWSLLLKYNHMSKVAVYKFAVPVFGVLSSAVLLSEDVFSWVTLLSMALVSVGIMLVNLSGVKITKNKQNNENIAEKQ